MAEIRQLSTDTGPAPPVLVVEDDREQRETLCAMIDLEGFGHAAAANGREALDRLSAATEAPGFYERLAARIAPKEGLDAGNLGDEPAAIGVRNPTIRAIPPPNSGSPR